MNFTDNYLPTFCTQFVPYLGGWGFFFFFRNIVEILFALRDSGGF